MVVAVIGAGVIGSSIARSLVRTGFEDRVIAADRRVEQLNELEKEGLTVTMDNRRAASRADIVILCVKPKDVREVLEEIRDEIKDKLVISIAAAVDLEFLENVAPEARFVRAMPNIAVLVQESFTAYCAGSDVTSEEKAKAEKILGLLGRVVEVDEKQMDAITALSGCAPGYLSVIVEAMVYAGLGTGLPKELALTASAQSMLGTGKLILEARKEPLEVKNMVATPGGVTEEELRELDRIPLRQTFLRAVKAGASKSKRISKGLSGKET